MKKDAYVNNVDDLIADTPLDQVLVHYGLPPSNRTSGEHRINCVFNAECSESSYGDLAIGVSHPAKQIYCHVCSTRGNLLTLIHGLETHAPPTGGKLRGQQFKAALHKLKEIRGEQAPTAKAKKLADRTTDDNPGARNAPDANPPLKRNAPLSRHENEAARKLADLYEDLVTDPAEMSPAAAQYVRSREWMTPEVMRKWGIGYMPRNGRSMFRGWLVYTHRNQQGEPISYSGRDPLFEEKHATWLRQGSLDAPRKPMKHKYVKGFHRGLELYGQQMSRLDEAAIQQSLERYGLIVVEGANDVIRLDAMDLAAVGLCSNRATETQIEKIRRFSMTVANKQVLLLPDNDEEGEAGFRDLLWDLVDAGLRVQLGWSRTCKQGRFDGLQPEQINKSIWSEIEGEIP